MADDVTIRHGILANAEELAAFGGRAFHDAFAGQVDEQELTGYVAEAFNPSQLVSELSAPGSIFLLAEADGALVGYARLLAEDAPVIIPCSNPVRLVRLYVDDARIGSGVGAALMRASLAEAVRMGCDALWLRVWERNARAIRFYERWGFSACGSIDCVMAGGPKTDLVMRIGVGADGSPRDGAA